MATSSTDLQLADVREDLRQLRGDVTTGMTQINGRIDQLSDQLNGRIDQLNGRIDKAVWTIIGVAVALSSVMTGAVVTVLTVGNG